MRRSLSLLLAVLVVATLVAATWIYRTLPPRAISLAGSLPATIALGAYHVHSNRSDGSGSVDAIARAAHDAGLTFVILTDHGDGTASPLAPSYRSGVLCIDAVEINTAAGHLVALGLDTASPYPLAGLASDVLEDIHRRGGWAVAAHPDSPKPDLQWRDWTAPIDGLEWFNVDSEWRDQTTAHLVAVGARLLVRPSETIASLFRRPALTIRRWDALARRRTMVGMTGLDAHANVAGHPRYVDMFRTVAQAVVLDAPLSGDATRDSASILGALRRGRTYAIVRAFAGPAALEFEATPASTTLSNATAPVGMGDRILAAGPLTWRASVPAASSAHVALFADGREIAAGRGEVTYTGPPTPGEYRVEVGYPGYAMPWIVSNPIYVGPAESPRLPNAPDALPPDGVLDLTPAPNWRVEHDNGSTAAIERDGPRVRVAYALGGGRPAGQYAAAVVPVVASSGFDRVILTARADRPMRLSLQVRLPGGGGGQRWRRSIYVDEQVRTIVVRLESFEPADHPTSQRPIVSLVRELLVVVDTLNTLPGRQGTVWISSIGLGRARPDGATSGR